LRIAYLSESIIPSRFANSVHVMKMCNALAGLGAEVSLYALRGNESAPDLYKHYGVPDSFQIKLVSSRLLLGRPTPIALLMALRAKFDGAALVYGRNLTACFFASLLGLPVIYESHTPASGLRKSKKMLLNKLVRSRQIKGFVVISKPLFQDFKEIYNLPDEKLLVAHDGADEPDNTPVKSFSNDDFFHIGYVGQLYPGRGMEIIEGLARQCPYACIHVVGGNNEDIERWRNRYRDVGNLIFHGFVPPAETAGFRAACQVLLAPYQRKVTIAGGNNTVAWMSPLKIFEYMSAGRPIVCSDLPVLHEVMEDGRNCVMCPPEEVESWRRAIDTLWRDLGMREKLGQEAYRDFQKEYSWKIRAKKILNYFV